jgi:tetratricopeptide (TPR) repeat protein
LLPSAFERSIHAERGRLHMASVFLSYDREDAGRARHFAQTLEKEGHEVWWDLHVRGGAQFSKVIEEALKAANAVVVLWSRNAIDSAWVRDEAAAGRDSGRLVPVTIDGTEPPLGFRQFQTIDLSRWKGRGTPAELRLLLDGIAGMGTSGQPTPRVSERPGSMQAVPGKRSHWFIGFGVVALMIVAAVTWWLWQDRGNLPVVEVTAANASPQSQAAASDLFVKLGSLAQVGQGKWQLVDASSAPSHPDLVFRTADTGSAQQPRANLVLLDGKDDGLLWSREFSFPAGGEADLRQQLSLTAGRVLGCALETQEAGGLPRNLFKLFLDACASLSENAFDEPAKVARSLRTIVQARPTFEPAWGRLIDTDLNQVEITEFAGDHIAAVRQLRNDMAKARKIAPDVAALAIADLVFLPDGAYAKKLELLAKALERSPDDPKLLIEQSGALQSVGRMSDAVSSSQRAAKLDPLSPAATTQYLRTLAYAGQIESARKELAQAQRLWAGTGALRDAEWGFYLRFGDPVIAKRIAPFHNPVVDSYLDARADSSPANVAKVLDNLRQYRAANPYDGWLVQTFAAFAPVDEVFQLIAAAPADSVARDSYVLFRPELATVRRDPRFMDIAKRIGLLDYWRSTGKWPDFCAEPHLPYACRAEAAKYG